MDEIFEAQEAEILKVMDCRTRFLQRTWTLGLVGGILLNKFSGAGVYGSRTGKDYGVVYFCGVF